MRRSRRIKIIATLGPASADRAAIADLFEAGADVFRINMSHASHEALRERVTIIRSLEMEYGRPIGILADLQGPKLRVGEFEAGAALLRKGEVFTLDSDPTPGNPRRVFLPHPEILESLHEGHRLSVIETAIRTAGPAMDPCATRARRAAIRQTTQRRRVP